MTIVTPVGRRLAEAEAALHELKLGRAVIEVDFDGRRTRFVKTDIDKLEGYIDDLREEQSGRRKRNGAIGILFG